MAQGTSLLRSILSGFSSLIFRASQDHNRKCLERLEPLLRHDKRALKYLRREAERGIGIAGAGPGGLTIDWN